MCMWYEIPFMWFILVIFVYRLRSMPLLQLRMGPTHLGMVGMVRELTRFSQCRRPLDKDIFQLRYAGKADIGHDKGYWNPKRK